MDEAAVQDCRNRLDMVIEPKVVLGMPLQEMLGKGGMGRVYRAHQRSGSRRRRQGDDSAVCPVATLPATFSDRSACAR